MMSLCVCGVWCDLVQGANSVRCVRRPPFNGCDVKRVADLSVATVFCPTHIHARPSPTYFRPSSRVPNPLPSCCVLGTAASARLLERQTMLMVRPKAATHSVQAKCTPRVPPPPSSPHPQTKPTCHANTHTYAHAYRSSLVVMGCVYPLHERPAMMRAVHYFILLTSSRRASRWP